MQTEWQLQEARNNLSQLIRQAVAGDTQVVTVHGRPAAVEVSTEDYARLTGRGGGKLSAALLNLDIAGDELAGRPMPVMDGLLMACAQCRGLTVVTRNVQDFEPFPRIFNPWGL